MRDSPLTQDIVIGHVQYVLRDEIDGQHGSDVRSRWPTSSATPRTIDARSTRCTAGCSGNDAADASRLRWEWQYRHNPNNPGGTPVIWIAREGPTLVGQYATMPVRLQVHGKEVDASWGMDVMVAPERQRQGIGEVLFRTWDRHVGASLGLGLSDSSHRLFRKLRWPEPGPVPCLVKPLTRRALKRPTGPSR